MKEVPHEIITLVKSRQVLLSGKARHRLDTDLFDTDDLIHSVVHGKMLKKEKDEQGVSRYKYTIIGPSREGNPIYSCGKIVQLDKKSYFIITFHEAR